MEDVVPGHAGRTRPALRIIGDRIRKDEKFFTLVNYNYILLSTNILSI